MGKLADNALMSAEVKVLSLVLILSCKCWIGGQIESSFSSLFLAHWRDDSLFLVVLGHVSSAPTWVEVVDLEVWIGVEIPSFSA